MPDNTTPHIYITISRYSDFIANVTLTKNILQNKYGDLDESKRDSALNKLLSDIAEVERVDPINEELDRENRRELHNLGERFSDPRMKQILDGQEEYFRAKDHETYLQLGSSNISGLLDLIPEEWPKWLPRPEFRELEDFGFGNWEDIQASLRNTALIGALSLDLGYLPIDRQQVAAAVSNVVNRTPGLVPLKTELDVTLVVMQRMNTDPKDLDNIALEIVRDVEYQLKPRASRLLSELFQRIGDLQDILIPAVPLPSIRSFQVIETPRMSGDPPEGFLRMILRSGALGSNDIWGFSREVLNAWVE